MRRLGAAALATACLALVTVALWSSAVSADVVSPAGACSATGHFRKAGETLRSSDFVPSDVIVVPQSDVVQWSGHEHNKPIGYVGPRRAIEGAVQLELPGSFTVNVWQWSGTESSRYSNAGAESYSLPSILIGVKLPLKGYERDNGVTICSGSVFVVVAGSKWKNPLGFVALGGTVLFLAGLVLSGFRKVRPAYDDVEP